MRWSAAPPLAIYYDDTVAEVVQRLCDTGSTAVAFEWNGQPTQMYMRLALMDVQLPDADPPRLLTAVSRAAQDPNVYRWTSGRVYLSVRPDDPMGLVIEEIVDSYATLLAYDYEGAVHFVEISLPKHTLATDRGGST